MTQQEIQERNEQIALMLGWEEGNLSGIWHKKDDTANYVVYSEHNNYPHRGLPFHRDWNWLMEAVEFIKRNIKTSNDTENAKDKEIFIDEWEFKITKYYLRLIQWTNEGWRMFDNRNRNLSILYIIGENCQTEIEAVFKVVSDFAKLYNDKKL
jgi:hypothetical protein